MDEREQRHRVSITLEVEELFAAMFGERAAHCVAGNGPAREWQKWCKKLSKELRKYVDANLYTDREHRECIRAVLDEINSSAHKPQAEREPLMVAGLSRLVLLLLGDLPNHHSHQKGERWNFRLSRFRTFYLLALCSAGVSLTLPLARGTLRSGAKRARRRSAALGKTLR